jgi:dipeptidyl aminopeptidase/acylaminoacyl peptidase
MRAAPRLTPRHLVALVCFAAACVLYVVTSHAARVASARGASAQRFNGLVAFTTNRNGVQGEIYVMHPDGAGQRNLTRSQYSETCPSFSPDGRRIAFSSIRDRVPNEVNFEIYVMNADGSNQTRLTQNTKFDHSPAWSPDGTRVVFTSRRDGNFEIYSMNSSGGGETRLTDHPNDDIDADWDGYNYWLLKLERFDSDWRKAEMVRAFLDSTEYRQRFCAP